MSPRSFTHAPAARRPDPVLLGISGPSSSGKTKTALRLATGLVAASGGEVFGIDTEEGRMAKYAPSKGRAAEPPHTFAFQHVLLNAPYNPLSYVEAIKYCEAQGAGAIIVDSMSHEHEGEGGRIDSAEKEAERRAKLWRTTLDKVKAGAYALNSGERTFFRTKIGRRKCHIILCFRAKESVELGGADKVKDIGFTPIGADAFVWELDSSILLLPHAAGVPTWRSEKKGELLCLKCDDTHRGVLDDGDQLTEQHGERLARASGWKIGGAGAPQHIKPDATSPAHASQTDGARASPSQTTRAPSPSADLDDFPGARPLAPTLVYAGFEYDFRQDADVIETAMPIDDMNEGELKEFAGVLIAMIQRAPDGRQRQHWYDKQSSQLLRLRARAPGQATRVEQALQRSLGVTAPKESDASVLGAEAGGRVAQRGDF